MFGRATITLGIGPHSSYVFFFKYNCMKNKCSAVAEMGDCLATINMGRKLGAVPLMGEAGSHVT